MQAESHTAVIDWRTQIGMIEWSTLEHAYGDAGDVPQWLVGLSDAENAENSLHELWAAVLHQGTIYDSSLPAFEIMASLLASGDAAEPHMLTWLIAQFMASASYCLSHEAEDEFLRAIGSTAERVAADVSCLIDSEDVELAVGAALLQGVIGQVDEAALARLVARAERIPVTEAEAAAVAALARMGYAPDETDPRLGLAASLARVAEGSTDSHDIAMIVKNWEVVPQTAPLVGLAVEDPAEWLAGANPRAATAIFVALSDATPQILAALVNIVNASRLHAPSAIHQIVELAHDADADPATLVDALRQLPPSAEVCNALHICAAKVTKGETKTLGVGECHVNPRADAALALLVAGAPRWEQHLIGVLTSDPFARSLMVTSSTGISSPPGLAFQKAGAQGSAHLVEAIRGVLRKEAEEPERDGAGAFIELLAGWTPEIAAVATPEVLALLPTQPAAAAKALAAWERADCLPQLRALGSDHVDVLLAIAQLSGELQDYQRVLTADTRYHTYEILQAWPYRDDPRFVDWCRSILGDSVDASDPGRQAQLAAAEILVGVGAFEAHELWPLVLQIIDGGRDPLASAAALATQWLQAGLVGEKDGIELDDLLSDIVERGRGDWSGLDPASRAVAGQAWITLRGEWPAAPDLAADVVRQVLVSWQGGAKSSAVGFIESLNSASAPVRESVAAAVWPLLESETRFDFVSSEAIHDEQLCADLRRVLAELEWPGL